MGNRNLVIANITPEEAIKNIDKKVQKLKSGKPFKSTFLINTVKGVINHPQLNIPAYTFYEDESYVEARRCFLANDI